MSKCILKGFNTMLCPVLWRTVINMLYFFYLDKVAIADQIKIEVIKNFFHSTSGFLGSSVIITKISK